MIFPFFCCFHLLLSAKKNIYIYIFQTYVDVNIVGNNQKSGMNSSKNLFIMLKKILFNTDE